MHLVLLCHICVQYSFYFTIYYPSLNLYFSLCFGLKQVNFPGEGSIKSYRMIALNKWLYHWSAFYQLKSIIKVKDLVTSQDLEYFKLEQNHFISASEWKGQQGPETSFRTGQPASPQSISNQSASQKFCYLLELAHNIYLVCLWSKTLWDLWDHWGVDCEWCWGQDPLQAR